MLIGNKYKIESDELNIILYKKRVITGTGKGHPATKPIGSEYWEAIGYYSSLKNALKGLVDFGVRETKLKDLKVIIARQDELHALIDNLKES